MEKYAKFVGKLKIPNMQKIGKNTIFV